MPAIPSILVGRIWPAATPVTAQYLQGGSILSGIGVSDVAAAGSVAPVGEANFGGPVVIKFRGTRFCLVVSPGVAVIIKRWNSVSDVWETVVTASTTGLGTGVHGLFPYQASNGVSGIFCPFWKSSGTVVDIASTTDGITWTVASAGVPVPGMFAGTYYTGRGHMHRNKLVTSYGGASTLPLVWIIIDPVGLTVSTITTVSDGAVFGNDAHCLPTYTTFNNRLFMLFTRNVTTVQAQLYELVGGVWASNVSLGGNTKASSGIGGVLGAGGHALVPVGSTKLVAIVKTDRNDGDTGNTTTGSRAFDLTPSGSTFTVLEKTSTLIPATLRPGGAGGNDSQRWTAFVDDVSVPGTPTQHFFLQANDTTGSFTYYPYVDSNTEMVGSGGPSVEYLLPHATWGGGSYVASNADMDVWITGLTPLLGGTRVSYRGSGLIAAASLRQSVHCATAAAFAAPAIATSGGGPGPGHFLSTGANAGILTADGVQITFVGQLVLVKNQGVSDNGRYACTQVGNGGGGTPYILTRTTDFDQAAEVYTGVFMSVAQGTVNAGTTWQVSSTGATPVVMETSAINFSQVTSMAGVLWRENCRLTTIAATGATPGGGPGVGKTLTFGGVATIDGLTVALNDRVLVRSDGANNGIYLCTQASPTILTRATDFDAVGGVKVVPGAYTYVTAGSAAGFYELVTAGSGLVIDTTSLDFTARNAITFMTWYSTMENTNMTQATLFNTATGGASVRDGVLQQINLVSPDGVTPFTADWKAGTGGDGLQNGQPVLIFTRLSV